MTGTRISAIFLRLLFHVCLIFATAAINTDVNSDDCPPDYHLPSHVVPTNYNVTLKLYRGTFHGVSTVSLKLLQYTRNISLHAYKLQIDEKSVMLVARTTNRMRRPQNYVYCRKMQILILKFYNQLAPGDYILYMTFGGFLLGTEGFVVVSRRDVDGRKRRSYVTLFEPTGARRAFPCWDTPKWKSTFDISIVHPRTFQAWSNMPQVIQSPAAINNVRTMFQTTPFFSIQYLTIALIEAERINASDTSVRYPLLDNINIWSIYEKKDQMRIMCTTISTIDKFLIQNMGLTMQGSAIDFIAFPNLPTKFVGSWGLAVVREEDVIDTANFTGYKLKVQRTVAQAIIRQFIQTLSSITDGLDNSVAKALELYLSYYIIEETHLYDQMTELFVVRIQQPAMHNDDILKVPFNQDIHDPFYSSIISNRASVIMRMLQHTVGKMIFNEGIGEFLNLNRTRTTKDLWQILERKVSTQQQLHVQEVKSYWESKEHYPALFVEENKFNNNRYTFPKLINATDGNDSSGTRKVPITYTKQMKGNFSVTSPIYWLMKGNAADWLDPEDWIIFNIQQIGYYRVQYSQNIWLKIANYQYERDHTTIHRLNRAQVIDDSYHFMATDQMSYQDFIRVISYLGKERDYIPWHTLTNVLHYMSPFFNFPESDGLKDHIVTITSEYLVNWKYEEHMEEITPLLVLHWSCKFGLGQCFGIASTLLEQHMQNPTKNLIKPGWENFVYCRGLAEANSTFWNQVAREVVQQNPKMLEHLACVNNRDLVLNLMNSFTSVNNRWTSLDLKQQIKLYYSLMRKQARHGDVIDFILEHFNDLMSSLNLYEKLGSLIMNVYSKCYLDKIWQFASNRYSGDNVTLNEVQRIIQTRKRLLKRQIDAYLFAVNEIPLDDSC